MNFCIQKYPDQERSQKQGLEEWHAQCFVNDRKIVVGEPRSGDVSSGVSSDSNAVKIARETQYQGWSTGGRVGNTVGDRSSVSAREGDATGVENSYYLTIETPSTVLIITLLDAQSCTRVLYQHFVLTLTIKTH